MEYKVTKICVNGSRSFKDEKLMDRELRKLIPKGSEDFYSPITGGANGADTLAFNWALNNDVSVDVVPAKWEQYGKRAGILRNELMIDDCDLLLSFWDGQSPGTKHAIEYAVSKYKPVTVIRFL
jgi:hypothetical protein